MSRDNMTILTWWAKSPLCALTREVGTYGYVCSGKEKSDQMDQKWFLVLETYCCEEELSSIWITTWYMKYTGIIYPQNQWGTSSPILMLTPILKLLSRKCQRRFSPGNDRSISFCNRAVGFQWKKPPLLSWCLSGHRICLKLYLQLSTLAPIYSIYLWKKSWNIFSKGCLLGGAVSFFACVMRQRFDLNEKTN